MQSQIRQQAVTLSSQQSLLVVKTLLSSSFGCIAYMRNLLPEDCFGESYLTAAQAGSMSYDSSSQGKMSGGRNVSSVRIKTVVRGFSSESDKLLDFLEKGVFEALEKQYLKSFIFAIYLDNQDPNNIVEAYTYNFSYHTVPGTDITVPLMSFEDNLGKLSLNHDECSRQTDPVTRASLKGIAPSLGDVKNSMKALIKRLLTITADMDVLPKRRFASYKLFYRDHTPADYEPPFFRAGDPEKDKFIFTTHGRSEVPEKWSVGSVATPHHSLAVQIKSIARYLPNDENNDAPFAGHVATMDIHRSDETDRVKNIEAQSKDAQVRNVAWNAEDADADWEPDPDYANDSGISLAAPLGLRTFDKTIVNEQSRENYDKEVAFCGRLEVAPSQVGYLLMKRVNTMDGASSSTVATQRLEQTQSIIGYLDTRTEILESGQSIMTNGIDTQDLKQLLTSRIRGDEAMDITNDTFDDCVLDMETQVTDFVPETDTHKRPTFGVKDNDEVDCSCGVTEDDGCVQCEGSCKKWYHLWCMGYHSQNDPRLPVQFICLDCRLRSDANFALVTHKYSKIMNDWSDLARFRRAIKIAEIHRPKSLQAFKGVAFFEKRLAEQLFKRLEDERFILLETTEIDSLGLLATQTTAKLRSAKSKKNAKTRYEYVFNNTMTNTATYESYFSPDSKEERMMLGLIGPKKRGRPKKNGETHRDSEMPIITPQTLRQPNLPDIQDDRSNFHNLHQNDAPQPVTSMDICDSEDTLQLSHFTGMNSQTQDETQLLVETVPEDLHLKRKQTSEEQQAVYKRLKISIGEGVDIEE